ncbi:MAG: ABC transporter ATP-binding protein [Pseudonocardiaceae bacterium]
MTTFGAIARQGGGWLPLLAVTDLLGSLTALGLPTVLGHVIDAIVADGGSGYWLAMAAGLIAVSFVCELAQAYAQPVCIAGTTRWLRNRLVRHVLAIGPAGSRRFETGDLVSRVSSNAVDAAQAAPSTATLATAVLPPVGSLVLLAFIDIWLAVAFLAGVILVAGVLRAFSRRTTEVNSSYQQTQGRIAARLAESLTGARTIAAAGTVEREERRVLEQLPDLHAQGLQLWLVLARSVAQAGVVGPLVLVAVLAAAGLELVHGRISAGDLFAASQYAVIGAGLGGLTGVFGQLARARAGVRRVAEVLTVDPVDYGGSALPPGPGRLEFRQATVRAGEAILLDRVDLTLPGGVAIALVGRSGAGKSVFAALAARLRDPDEGQVLLDGVPLGELSHQSLRRAIGCAFERPLLVGGTVADAMGMGHDVDRVRAAARATHAHEFVSRLPRGYDTLLADAPMSGGEAQRLGLARAWQAERLLVLDDATSSLDMVTEMQISRTLTGDSGERGGRTRLIATHRVSTAARADLVVWLEGGRVRAVGPHQRLWDEPAYREVFG